MKRETEVVMIINGKYGNNLKICPDDYSDFDAEGEKYLCEVKSRTKYYKEKYIELGKLFKNINHARIKDKEFIYVVDDPMGIFIFNISKNLEALLAQEIIDKPNMPIRTEFSGDKKINKLIYLLDESMATIL
jgi:hypothetical protein